MIKNECSLFIIMLNLFIGGSYGGSGGGNSNNLYPPDIQNMNLHPAPNYDPRRLFPFGLSPIPEVPSELASEVSSIASSPTPSYEDSDTEIESIRSRGSIMYSGSCDSIKSNATIHGKSSSESSTDSEDDVTEEDTEDEQESFHIQNIPVDTKSPCIKQTNIKSNNNKSENSSNTYSSEVTQVMHQRTFINNNSEVVSENEVNDDKNETQDRPEIVFDMGSGAATASEIFRHLQVRMSDLTFWRPVIGGL